jgi:ADP-ribosylglycohydrolase
MSTVLEKSFQGCLLGLAIGDALGYPVEFKNRNDLINEYGSEGVTDFVQNNWFKRGNYSDDTQMSIAVAKALISADIYNLDHVMSHIKKEFIEWANSDENNRAPGPTCMYGCINMEKGIHWFSSGDPYSKGCGAAMRSAPIGLVYHNDISRLIEVSRAVAISTHAHPTALSSSITMAASVAYAIMQRPVDRLLDYLLTILNNDRGVSGFHVEKVTYDPLCEQSDLLNKLKDILTLSPDLAFDQIGGGWIGEEAVAGALYCFLRTPDDFHSTVLTAANASLSNMETRGKGRCDSDSIGCIAGAISGAYNGIESIPSKWIKEIENRDLLLNLGWELAKKVNESGSMIAS